MDRPRLFYRQRLLLRFLEEGAKQHVLPPRDLGRARILDAGCGDGRISLNLAKKGWEVYALDSSPDSLRILKERLKANEGLAKFVKIYCQGLDHLSFPPSYFDAIICGEVLEHIEDDSKILCSFNRILRFGGICVISVPTMSKGWDNRDEILGHLRLYNLEDLKKKIKSNSFLLEKYLYWGFPLMKLYYRLIYLNWIAPKEAISDREKDFFIKLSNSKFSTLIASKIFRFDEIFGRHNWGMGLIVRLRKNAREI